MYNDKISNAYHNALLSKRVFRIFPCFSLLCFAKKIAWAKVLGCSPLGHNLHRTQCIRCSVNSCSRRSHELGNVSPHPPSPHSYRTSGSPASSPGWAEVASSAEEWIGPGLPLGPAPGQFLEPNAVASSLPASFCGEEGPVHPRHFFLLANCAAALEVRLDFCLFPPRMAVGDGRPDPSRRTPATLRNRYPQRIPMEEDRPFLVVPCTPPLQPLDLDRIARLLITHWITTLW